MGWTSTTASEYKENGSVNRKAECDKIYSGENDKYIWKVLKSSMVGNVYYGAIERTSKLDNSRIVFAAICKTGSDKRCGFNFSYKEMDETEGPCEYACPESILNLLTETDSEYAKAWRDGCYKYHENKKNGFNFNKCEVGTKIKFKCGENSKFEKGTEITLEKICYRNRKIWYGHGYKWSPNVIKYFCGDNKIEIVK